MVNLNRIVTLPLVLAIVAASARAAEDVPHVDQNGTLHIPAFSLPQSSFLSNELRSEWSARDLPSTFAPIRAACPDGEGTKGSVLAAIRRCQADAFQQSSFYKAILNRYAVSISTEQLAGINAETFIPVQGIARENEHRVLVNLHGGGFLGGWGIDSRMESIPIASVGRIRVVSVDYRLAPDNKFPAATEDATAVYKALLKRYEPEEIGIYGCSAGGLLTAETVAWIQKQQLPMPGAVGMFCSGGSFWGDGDSGRFGAARLVSPPVWATAADKHPYFIETDTNDPLAFPVRSLEALAAFPPSLLISSSRDFALSSVVYTHSQLVTQHVDAELHVWEGLDHAFFYDPELPQSREAYEVIVSFFLHHLGKQAALERVLSAAVDRYVQSDQVNPPEPCQILFIGSSSIAHWTTLAADLAPLPVINRGFGGSHIEYVNRWFNQIVAPYHPRAIVLYAGENDLAAGKSLAHVEADLDAFLARKSETLGHVPVYFISVKPSKLRFQQLPMQKLFNDAVQQRAAVRKDLHYIDVADAMLDKGRPKDLFEEDGLHMRPEGYLIWARAVRRSLGPNDEAEARSCHRTVEHTR